MEADQNKQIVQRIFNEGINGKNFSTLNQFIGKDYINHGLPDSPKGPQGFKEAVLTFINAFPDLNVSIENIVAEGDYVSTQGTMTGTHRGQFMGIFPTNKKVTVPYMDLWKLNNGKCVENWVQINFVVMMKQLNAIPEMTI